MQRFRDKALLLLLFAAIGVSLAAGPTVVGNVQRFYNRLEVLGRMFEIIESNYVEDVDADTIFEHAIDGVLENLDPHSAYYTAEEYRELSERYRGDYSGIGIQFHLYDGVLTVLDALEGGPSEQLGLRAGDQIIEIEGRDAVGLDEDGVFERLRGPRGTRVNVTIRRPGLDEPFEVEITRDQVPVSAVTAATLLDSGVGYIWLNTFSQKGADQIERYLREFERDGMNGFILDLRGNRGGLMNQAIRITDKFLEGGRKVVYTQGRTPNANGENYSTDRDTHPRFPMVVLVDHQSASASEIVAGALQDWDRALIAGQLTWGKALVQNQFPFQDGSALFLTIARYYTPSGRLIQRPYESGDDEAYLDPDWEQLEGEAALMGEAPDQRAVDDERPIFHTAAGREVRGGGGIAPDVDLEPTRVSRLALELWARQRVTFEYAIEHVVEHAETLPADLSTYIADYEVSDETYADFEAFVQSNKIRGRLEAAGIPYDNEELWASARDDLRMYLRADIAANVWGQRAGRSVLLQYDGQVQQAINLMPQATDLLEMRERLAGDE